MRNLLIMFALVLISGCSSIEIKGTLFNGKYTNANNTFEMTAPNYTRIKIVDGIMPPYSYVDFIYFNKSYSIEVYDDVAINDQNGFRSITPDFMGSYMSEKDGVNSYIPVLGSFSIISNNLSYDFVTTGTSKSGQKQFFYGRSIYLGPKQVAICMFYKNRSNNQSIDDFKSSFNRVEFDNICSSVKIKI
jgi:uncharacterized protein YceK